MHNDQGICTKTLYNQTHFFMFPSISDPIFAQSTTTSLLHLAQTFFITFVRRKYPMRPKKKVNTLTQLTTFYPRMHNCFRIFYVLNNPKVSSCMRSLLMSQSSEDERKLVFCVQFYLSRDSNNIRMRYKVPWRLKGIGMIEIEILFCHT